jgi:hypothetical protein
VRKKRTLNYKGKCSTPSKHPAMFVETGRKTGEKKPERLRFGLESTKGGGGGDKEQYRTGNAAKQEEST